MVISVLKQYELVKLERIGAIQHEIYRQIIDHDGGNGFSTPQNASKRRSDCSH